MKRVTAVRTYPSRSRGAALSRQPDVLTEQCWLCAWLEPLMSLTMQLGIEPGGGDTVDPSHALRGKHGLLYDSAIARCRHLQLILPIIVYSGSSVCLASLRRGLVLRWHDTGELRIDGAEAEDER